MELLCVDSESNEGLTESVIKGIHKRLTLERGTNRRWERPLDQCRSSA